MSNRMIVFSIAGLALAGFAAAAYFYTSGKSDDAPAAQIGVPTTSATLDAPTADPTPPQPASSVADSTPATPAAPTSNPAPANSTLVKKTEATNKPAAPAQTWNALVRAHSPTMGPLDAKVTIVEFFDPACEACRAFYPIVKQTMAEYPKDVRLVLRYAPFHQGSDEAVRILETARLQNVFEPVLEALLARQPEWAAHSGMDLDKAWAFAEVAGLDLVKAKETRLAPSITAALSQDIEDVKTIGVSGTPTFIVNGKPLQDFGVRQFQQLVRAEVAATP